MSATQQLSDLFKQADDSGEIVRASGRIMPDGWRPPVEGAIDSPYSWLKQFDIPIKFVSPTEMDGAMAMFCQRNVNEQHVDAWVQFPNGADVNDRKDRWCVWHEIGHAADFVMKHGDKLVSTPEGRFSSKHRVILDRWFRTIITWTPHDDLAYKTKPTELWAEVVACLVCTPERMPPEVLKEIMPDLLRLSLPLPATTVTPDAPPPPAPPETYEEQAEDAGIITDGTQLEGCVMPEIMKRATAALVGKTIKSVGYLKITGKEVWPVIILSDGVMLTIASYDEGNGPGVVNIDAGSSNASCSLCQTTLKRKA